MSKYHAKKVLSMDGIEFDSKLEAKRWDYLRGLEQEGRITNLRRQVVYELIPKQERLIIKQLKRKEKVEVRLGEHPVTYIADFVYKTRYNGPIAYMPTVDPLNWYTRRGDIVYHGQVGRGGEIDKTTIIDYDGEIVVVEDTKGMKTRDYIVKRKLMRYMENIAIREVKKPYEVIW